jgi:small subunit ribosomal protein S36
MRGQLRARVKAIGRVPPLLWGITALFGLLLALWSTFAPLGRAPDEPVHADLVDHISRGGSFPGFDGRHTSTAMISAFVDYVPGLNGHWLTPESALPRARRETFGEYGGAEPSVYMNQMPQHPPMYYWTTGSALRVERAVSPDSDPPLDREWNVIRLMNAVMVLPLPLLTWFAARRLGTGTAVATAAAIVPLAIPQLLHIGASINNDNLLILLSAVVAVLVADVLRGDRRPTRAVLLGTIAGLALLTKAFALVLLPWIALAYGYQVWHERDRWKQSIGCLLIAATTMFLVGGWWPARNIWRGDGPYPSVLSAAAPVRTGEDPIDWSRQFVSNIVQRFWGDFGYFEAPMTQALVIIATVTAAAMVVLAFTPPRRRQPGSPAHPTRGQLMIFASVFPILLGLVAYWGYDHRAIRSPPPFMHGRYLFGAIVPFCVVIAVGIVRVLGRWSPVAVLGAALLMQLDAARVGLRAWWAEPDASVARSIDAVVRWSPWPVFVTYAVAISVLVCTAVTLADLVRGARAPGDPPHDPADRPPTRVVTTARASS